jgi:hypothetical protein
VSSYVADLAVTPEDHNRSAVFRAQLQHALSLDNEFWEIDGAEDDVGILVRLLLNEARGLWCSPPEGRRSKAGRARLRLRAPGPSDAGFARVRVPTTAGANREGCRRVSVKVAYRLLLRGGSGKRR